MDGNGLKDFILYTLLGFIFIYALVKLNVFSSRRGVRHTLKEREKHISQVKIMLYLKDWSLWTPL